MIIKGRSLFKANRALGPSFDIGGDGGVATTHDYSRTLVSGHTIFEGNNATGSGEWIGLWLVAATVNAGLMLAHHDSVPSPFCCRWDDGDF